MASFETFLASFSQQPNERGRQFEVFSKWYLSTAPEWTSRFSDIWLWADFPDRWGRDCGIDLVARDSDGRLWAIQAKCVSSDRDITKSEIDSFLSESSDPRIYGRLLIASTNGIGQNAKQVIERQSPPVVCVMLDQLTTSQVTYPDNLEGLNYSYRSTKHSPKKHQDSAIVDVVRGLSCADRGQLIMACGTGKTLTALWISERLESDSTIVFVPSLSLLSQTLREWTAQATVPFRWLCVCSDHSVHRAANVDDAFSLSISDLGVPVTSNSDEIARFLTLGGRKVIFSTYQSSQLIQTLFESGFLPRFELMICDEAHRCAGRSSAAFSGVLKDKYIPAARRLFMTATPRVISGIAKAASGQNEAEFASMDDSLHFGEVLHKLSFSEAIQKGLLTDFRVVVAVLNGESVYKSIGARQVYNVDGSALVDNESLAAHISIEKAMRKYGVNRLITFHSRVERAKAFSINHSRLRNFVPEEEQYQPYVSCDYVSGDMPSRERNRKLQTLKNVTEHGVILSNARCLTEGIDVPSLDGIAFVDPRGSQIDIVQAVGRAIRKSDGKRLGTIIIPVFVRDIDDPRGSLSSSSFRVIWDVVNAIKAHDDGFSDALDASRISIGANDERSFSTEIIDRKIVFEAYPGIDEDFIRSLKVRAIEFSTSSWMFMYGRLLRYVDDFNECPPAAYKSPDGVALGAWVSSQRQRVDNLSSERRTLLESVATWRWDPLNEQWENGYACLSRYTNSYLGRIPNREDSFDGFPVGKWVHTQRRAHDEGRLIEERSAKLESIPGWKWRVFDDNWMKAYQELVEFQQKEGHASPDEDSMSPTGRSLMTWVVYQRHYRFSRLSEERRALLEAIPTWSWSSPDGWMDSYNSLKDYLSESDGICPTKNFVDKAGLKIGKWVLRQRSRRADLPPLKVKLLEKLHGWSWEGQRQSHISDDEGRWHIAMRELLAYTREHGHARPPVRFFSASGYKLGAVVMQLRRDKDRLTDEQVRFLSDLPFWSWDLNEDLWNEAFQKLELYVSKFGSIPASNKVKTEDGFGLGYWLYAQRVRFRSRLTAAQIAKLESLPSWDWNEADDQVSPLNSRNQRELDL